MTAARRLGRRLLHGTVRLRVTAVASFAALVVLSAASLFLVLAQRAAMVETLDEALDQQADAVAGRLDSGRPVRSGDLPTDDVVVEVVGPDGELLAASEGLAGRLERAASTSGPGVTTVELPGNGEPGRLLVREAGDDTVVVAGSLDDVRDGTAALAGSLLVAVPLSTAVLAAIVWWAVGRVLRPVEDIRARVDAISAPHLDQRVPEPETSDEIARLARTMNAMLGRLQDSAERQRRFVADASHELRSPLTRMRTDLEVDRLHPGSADPARTAASVLAETVALQRLVDDLLVLARGDEDGALQPAQQRPVDLDELVEGLVRRRRSGAGVRIETRGVQPVQVEGDAAQLERVVANLLDNALRHAQARVVVEVHEAPDGRAEVVVEDDGPGIPPDQRERVFQRFTRLDDARAADDGGTGLGLAIAREIAERHGGTLTVEPSGPPGARLVLALPAAGDRHIGRVSRGRAG